MEIQTTKTEATKHDFYTVKFDQQGQTIKSLRFDKMEIYEILKELGIYYYDFQGSKQYIKIKNNRIRVIDEDVIKYEFEDYIKKLDNIVIYNNQTAIKITPKFLLGKFYEQIPYLFSNLEMLRPEKELNILQDDEDTKYIFFQNTVVAVHSDGIEHLNYEDLNGYIWESGILPHSFVNIPEKGDFEKFIDNICSGDMKRKSCLMSYIGYLLHDYYDCTLRALLLTDANEDNAGEATGRTGKGIIGKALGHVLNASNRDNRYCCIPGKDIDLRSDTRYSLADVTTQLIHIEDIYKGADFEALFNDITDGAKIRRPYQICPIVRPLKMMLSVNNTIRIDSESKKGRLIVFELANYYNADFTPEMEFKRRFFGSKWGDYDWFCFYSFMIRCCQIYLKKGILIADEINYALRSLQETTGDDFVYWVDRLFRKNENKHERQYNKKDIFSSFLTDCPDYNKNSMTQKKFTSWVKQYFKIKQIPYTEYRGTVDQFITYPSPSTVEACRKNQHIIKEAI